LALIGSAVAVMPARAAGTVQLELVGDAAQGAAMLFHEWGQALTQAGISSVHFRAARETDKIGIETIGTADSPIYVITGSVESRDELLLPGGRFRRSDVGRLAQWLKDLAQRGPNAGKEQKTAFGLSAAQLQKVHDDLSTPVGSATQGVARRQVVQNMAARLKVPLKLDAQTVQALGDDKVEEDLSDLTCGTALACMLRAAGYGLVPRATGGELTYAVVPAQSNLEAWPVGWPPEKSANEALPALFEFLNVNVQDFSAAKALDAIAQRLKVPALLDHSALARHGVDPAKAMVTLPRSRTNYSIALRKLLFQAGMKFEVRCDEAGNPFLWITSLKPG
jgi:hypothetical protein